MAQVRAQALRLLQLSDRRGEVSALLGLVGFGGELPNLLRCEGLLGADPTGARDGAARKALLHGGRPLQEQAPPLLLQQALQLGFDGSALRGAVRLSPRVQVRGQTLQRRVGWVRVAQMAQAGLGDIELILGQGLTRELRIDLGRTREPFDEPGSHAQSAQASRRHGQEPAHSGVLPLSSVEARFKRQRLLVHGQVLDQQLQQRESLGSPSKARGEGTSEQLLCQGVVVLFERSLGVLQHRRTD
ncbi:MAG: hypothetical protein GY913_13075 [Proteobacteria bacterium]|nr:hypothetical protein [Pseudomonadota bacterium]MCP4917840.1 hypothetical protein [Pseudomonadota bacterium]